MAPLDHCPIVFKCLNERILNDDIILCILATEEIFVYTLGSATIHNFSVEFMRLSKGRGNSHHSIERTMKLKNSETV